MEDEVSSFAWELYHIKAFGIIGIEEIVARDTDDEPASVEIDGSVYAGVGDGKTWGVRFSVESACLVLCRRANSFDKESPAVLGIS